MTIASPFARPFALAVLGAVLAGVPVRAMGQAAASAPPAATYRAAPGAGVDVPGLVARLLPSVVNISTVRHETPAAGDSLAATASGVAKRRSLGSGFVIDPGGLILTNRHVIEKASEITVTFSDGTSLAAELVAAAVVDIAILRVKPERPLPAVTWGDSFTLRHGMPVIAIGNPLGYSSTVTMGIVSALDRDIKSSPYDDYVQTDASINPGSSGGPLFNLAGEVVGVNTAIGTTGEAAGSVGIGFAIPSNDAQFVLNRLMQFDRIRLGWLALKVQKPTEAIAEALGLGQPRGVVVTSVDPSRGALAAAVLPGDVILDVDGTEVRDVRTFNRAVGVQIVGTTTPLRIWREGREMQVPVAIEDSPDDLRQSMAMTLSQRAAYVDSPDLGLNLSALTAAARQRLKLPEGQPGVMVAGIEPFSRAAEQGVLPGEAILKVQREGVGSVREFWSRVDRARAARQARILLLVRGEDGDRWVALPPS